MYGTTSCSQTKHGRQSLIICPMRFRGGVLNTMFHGEKFLFLFFLSSLPDRRNTPPNETKTEIRDNYIYIYIDCTTWEIITEGAKKERKRKELLGCCCCVSPIVFPSIHVYRTHLPRRALFFRGLFYIFLRDCHARSN